MLLTREQRGILESEIQRYLGANPNTDSVSLFVGADIAQNMPTVSFVRTLAGWIVKQAISQPTPGMMISIIELLDNGDIKMRQLSTLALKWKNDPSSWRPKVQKGILFQKSRFHQAAFWGPVAAAIIGGIALLIPTIINQFDRIPPTKPNIVTIERKKNISTDDIILVKYEGAIDQGQSGLKVVRLWYRFDDTERWFEAETKRTGQIGSFEFIPPNGSGSYSFDLVATDQNGNHSAKPVGTDGQRNYHFISTTQLLVQASENSSVSGASSQQFPPKNPSIMAELAGWINIPIYFHIIHDDDRGYLSEDTLLQQVEVLNEAFAPGEIKFYIAQINRTNNDHLFRGSTKPEDIKNITTDNHVEPFMGYNIYTFEASNVLEVATFPWDMQFAPEKDGVRVNYKTFPGGAQPYHIGQNLVHGTGHWLGLLHTFQNGCDEPGDEVDDTPSHSGANYGIPDEGLPHNACSTGQLAPVRNFMNYVDDHSLNHFTEGQFKRMRVMTAIYRRNFYENAPAIIDP